MTEWTPKPGELTVDTDTDMTHCEGVWRYVRDVKTSSFPNMCRRLLPAVNTAEEAWEALLKITTGDDEEMPPVKNPHIRYLHLYADDNPENEDAYQGMVGLSRSSDGELIRATCTLHYDSNNDDGMESDDASDRVRQVYGAIREWLKQVKHD